MTLVVTVEEASDPLQPALVPVPRGGNGFCRTCHRPCSTYNVCLSCHRVENTVSAPCRNVIPVSLMDKDTQLYETLKSYKGPVGSTSRRLARMRTIGLLARFLRDHGGCVAPAGWDTVTHVPSTSGRHPGIHPIVQILSMYSPLKNVYADLLTTGPGNIERRLGADDGYLVRSTARDKRVLIVDDTWTTGAHAQSAASALTLAGATVVGIVPIGRLIDPNFDGAAWWKTQRNQRFDFDTCCAH